MKILEPNRSTPFGFIPGPLIIPERPELKILPYNIMFASQANIDGVDTSGTAIYLPNINTYKEDSQTNYMRYFNKYQKVKNQDYVDIWYFKESGRYEGAKYVAGRQRTETYGRDWKSFFIHLTMIGLIPEEACLFKPM